MGKEYSSAESVKIRDKALRLLGTKKDVKVFGNRILILNGKDVKSPKHNDLGLGCLRAIDVLVSYGNYYKYYVNNFKI